MVIANYSGPYSIQAPESSFSPCLAAEDTGVIRSLRDRQRLNNVFECSTGILGAMYVDVWAARLKV